MTTSEVSGAKPAVINIWDFMPGQLCRSLRDRKSKYREHRGGGHTWMLSLEVLRNMDLFRVGGSGAGCVLPALKGHSACWVESTSGNSCLTLEEVSQAWRRVKGELMG